MVLLAHEAGLSGKTGLRVFKSLAHSHRIGRARLVNGTGQGLNHHVHAQMSIVLCGFRETLEKALVKRLARCTRGIGHPLGYCHHTIHTRLANGCRCSQGIAVEGVELALKAPIACRLDEQREVIAPVARDHRLCAAGLDLGDVGQKVLDLADGMQIFTDHLDIAAFGLQLAARLTHHCTAKAVVLTDQVDRAHLLIRTQHLHERGHAHISVRIKTEVPEAAAVIGQGRFDRSVVQKQDSTQRVAFVVLVDGLDQCCGRSAGVALQDVGGTILHSRLQSSQGSLVVAFAVVLQQRQRSLALGSVHTPTCIDLFNGHGEIAHHSGTRVAKGTTQALNQGQLDGLGRPGC